MVNVSNPVFINQYYCQSGTYCKQDDPSKVKISEIGFTNIKGSSAITPVAVKLLCRRKLPCEKVWLTDVDLTYSGKKGTLTLCQALYYSLADALACATWSYSPTRRSRRNFTNVLMLVWCYGTCKTVRGRKYLLLGFS